MKTYLLIALIITFVLSVHANEKLTEEIKKEGEEISKNFKLLKDTPLLSYPEELTKLSRSFDAFIERKKIECKNGPLIEEVDETGKTKKIKKTLTKDERELCFRELKLYIVKYTEDYFLARKRYLKLLTQKSIKNLENSKKEELSKIEKEFSRYK